MSTLTPRVQPPPFQLNGPTATRTELGAALDAPDKSGHLLDAITRALYDKMLGDYADSDARVKQLLDEPALTPAHLHRLTHTLADRDDAGLEPARIALCSHPLISGDALLDALWMAPAQSLRAVSAATSRLIPNALDWERRAYNAAAASITGHWAQRHKCRIDRLVARWETRTEGDRALRSFICEASFLFSDQRVMFAAARAITAAPAGRR